MDERSHHGHQQQPQQTVGSPWPQYAQPAYAPPQQPPTMQQFQYAANGYVLPGASEAHGAPMSAHGGTIGMPPQQPGAPMYAQQPAPMYAQPAPQAHAHPMHGGAAMMLDANGQPQAWAFPTPNGLQLVQPGAASMVPHGAMQHAGMPGAPSVRRLRWETIVPALAIVCLIAAIGLFMHDFDRITGRDGAASAAPSAKTTKPVDDTPSTPAATVDVAAVVTKANALFATGNFNAAADLLHPVIDVANPDPAAIALHDKVDAANARNTALLKRLGVERRDQRWTAVIATIGQIEQLRPLDRQLVSLRTRARAAQRARTAKAAADRAAAKQRAARPSSAGASGGGGGRASTGHRGHAMPPAAGGSTGASSNVRPPANVPKGSIPKPPEGIPNPTGGNPGVVGGGGPAAETMCAVNRAPRHNGEDHGTC